MPPPGVIFTEIDLSRYIQRFNTFVLVFPYCYGFNPQTGMMMRIRGWS